MVEWWPWCCDAVVGDVGVGLLEQLFVVGVH